jgi:hypothetical protein
MKENAQVVKKYIDADCEYRLMLFLRHPSLRNRFIDIDLNEKRTPGRKIRTFLKSFLGLNGEPL